MEHALNVHSFLGLRLDCSASLVRAGEASEPVPDVVCGSGALSILPYVVLLLIMGGTTYYQQKQMQASQGSSNPQAQQMMMMMRIMPVFLVVIGYSFPAALVLYWTITNLWTIGQQRIMLKGWPPIIHPGSDSSDSSEKARSGSKAASSRALSTGPKPAASKPSSKTRASSNDGRKTPAASSPSAKRKRKR
jgi:YidC/Oxa1 family membrane protein insertase